MNTEHHQSEMLDDATPPREDVEHEYVEGAAFLTARMDNPLLNEDADSPSTLILAKEAVKDVVQKRLPCLGPVVPLRVSSPSPHIPSTPPRRYSDVSSSSSSSSATPVAIPQEQQRRPLQPSSPMSHLYNPLTNYSPQRPRRREIMGMSICTNPIPSPSGFVASRTIKRRTFQSEEDDDESSIDSVEALERCARQIRVELRHKEMVELAVEAERAAEAGEERFAGRPSTYGFDDSGILFSNSQKQHNRLKRHGSYSEGTRILPIGRLLSNKIGVLALRDVNEVFPNFTEFHIHLRTHFARHRVPEKTLIFQETKGTSGSKRKLLRRRHTLSLSPSRQGRQVIAPPTMAFLQQFSFDRWVSRGDSEEGDVDNACESSDETTDTVGDLLAEHLHTPSVDSIRRPKVKVPAGLELPKEATHWRPSLLRERKISGHTVDTEPTTSSSEHDQQPYSLASSEMGVAPRALFDQDEAFESDENADADVESIEGRNEEESHARPPLTPAIAVSVLGAARQSLAAKSGHDFLTPARLRDIRDAGLDIDQFADGLEANLLFPPPPPPRSARHESPMHVDIDLEPRSMGPDISVKLAKRTTDPSLMLPNYFLDKKKNDGTLDNVVFTSLKPTAAIATKTQPGAEYLIYHEKKKQPEGVGYIPFPNEKKTQLEGIGYSTFPEEKKLCDRKENEETCTRSFDEMVPATPAPFLPGPFTADVTAVVRRSLTAHIPHTSVATTKTKAAKRSVKVSVYGKSPSAGDTETGERIDVLQHSQVIPLTPKQPAATRPTLEKMDSMQTPTRDCSCLSLSPTSSWETRNSPGDENATETRGHSMVRRSTSTGALESLESTERWNPCSRDKAGDDGSRSHGPDQQVAHSSLQAAMDMFSKLSPSKGSPKRRSRRALYVKTKDNEDFLRNYLYCSKPRTPSPDAMGSADTSHNGRLICGDVLNLDSCCVAMLVDTTLGPRKSPSAYSLSLSRDGSYSRVEPETWLDKANEQFDGVLGNLTGGTFSNRNSRQRNNLLYQAPSLKMSADSYRTPQASDFLSTSEKAPQKPAGEFQREATTMTKNASSAAPQQHRRQGHVRHLSIPQPLYEEPQEGLSETQFQLIYGVSREHFSSLPTAERFNSELDVRNRRMHLLKQVAVGDLREKLRRRAQPQRNRELQQKLVSSRHTTQKELNALLNNKSF